MLFVELRFFVFFCVVLAVYWSLKTNSARKNFLFVASYFFYGAWDWRFSAMLFALSFGDYYFARRIGESEQEDIRKRFVIASLTMNLGVLGFFKYFNFFIESAVALGEAVGVHLNYHSLHIVLPVGVSFFTFQSLSYTIDVYRREIPPERNPRDYMLFAAFFPQLVAGPIVRPKYFLPQLQCCRTLTPAMIRTALMLFLIGFIKKSCIADNVSPYVDQVFLNPSDYATSSVVAAVWLYAVQIFCDFSGYSDMAIAVAKLMGYELAINFNAPYLACSLRDFWQRWHISLSTWIRDYIYVSLGGRSSNRLLTYRNLMLTMLAGGLWHGAAWTFVMWGGLHGAGQVVQQEFNRLFPRDITFSGQLRILLSWFLTLQFVCLCWVFFRANDFSHALQIIQIYCLAPFSGLDHGATTLPHIALWLAPILLLVQYLIDRYKVEETFAKAPLIGYASAFGILSAFALAFLPLGYKPFIYFQF